MPRNERYRTAGPDSGQSVPNTDQSNGAGDDVDPAGGSAVATASFHRTLSTTRRVLFSRELRLFVGFVACFFAAVQATDTYIQPITETLLADALESVTVAGRPLPEPALLGVLYATFAAVGAVASDRAGAVYSQFGSRNAVVWIALGVAGALLVPWFVALLAIPVFVLLKGAYALSKPLVTQYVNDHAEAANRATVLSATSMVFALVRAPLKPVAGVVADATSPIATVALLGVGLLGVVGVVAVRSDW